MNVSCITSLAVVITCGLMLACSVSVAGEGGGATGAVDTPRVLPEGCVDTSSLKAIGKTLFKRGMTDHQKVLAVYHWWRRVTYHFRNMGADRRDTLRVINSYGYNLCGSHSGSMMVLFKELGFKARPAFVNGASGKDGYGGHTVEEVFYDGKWHAFDVMTNFCVLNRDKPPTIASLAQLQKDPTLVTKAVEEKRTVGGYITCTNAPDLSFSGRKQFEKLGWGGWLVRNGLKPDLRWGCLCFGMVDADGKERPGTLAQFWAKAASKWDCKKAGSLYGGKHVPGLLDITLKVNERWVMLWDNLGKWVERSSFPKTGPFHTCGHCDELDDVNFKYFEPYGKRTYNGTKVCYRYYANGFLEWSPKSVAEVKAASRIDGDELIIPVKSPGPVVGIELDLEAGPGAGVTLKYGRKTSKHVWSAPADADGLQKITVPYVPARQPFCAFDLKIAGAKPGAVKRLRTIYQLNMFALGSFKPGKNKVSVSAKRIAPKGTRLVVEYRWSDGDTWKDERSIRKEFRELPASFDVEVKGRRMPRMKSLELLVK